MIQWNYVIPAVIVGTMGWIIYLGGMQVIGLVAGAGAGAMLGIIASGLMDASWAPMVFGGIGAAVGGALGFWMIRVFQKWLFFAVGAVVAGTLGYRLIGAEFMRQYFDSNSLAALIAVGLFALAGGILCVQMRRYVMAIITSIIGVFLLVPGLPPEWAGLGLVIGLVVFLSIQVGLVNKFVGKEAFDRRTRVRPREDNIDA